MHLLLLPIIDMLIDMKGKNIEAIKLPASSYKRGIRTQFAILCWFNVNIIYNTNYICWYIYILRVSIKTHFSCLFILSCLFINGKK